MDRRLHSRVNTYMTTAGAQYVLWAEKTGIDLEVAPPVMRGHNHIGGRVTFWVVDYGIVSLEGLPVRQAFVVYRNELGQRFERLFNLV